MEANYQHFIERLIQRYEGGYGWDQADSGGPTKYGITCYDLAEHLGEKMTSKAAWAPRVRAMTLGTAEAIYKKKYATACRFDDLNSGCDCVVLDFGINSGSSRAVRYAQGVVGVKVDGVLGPMTLAAINKADPAHFINDLCDMRLSFLKRLGIWKVFGRGWSARVRDLRGYSLGLLKGPNPHLLGESHERKPQRIPKAYGKSYGSEYGREKHGHANHPARPSDAE